MRKLASDVNKLPCCYSMRIKLIFGTYQKNKNKQFYCERRECAIYVHFLRNQMSEYKNKLIFDFLLYRSITHVSTKLKVV